MTDKHIELNGFPIKVKELKHAVIDSGGTAWSNKGTYLSNKVGVRRQYNFEIICTTKGESDSLIHLLNGEGHVFTFKKGLEASTGLKPMPGHYRTKIMPDSDNAPYKYFGEATVQDPISINCQLDGEYTVALFDSTNDDSDRVLWFDSKGVNDSNSNWSISKHGDYVKLQPASTSKSTGLFIFPFYLHPNHRGMVQSKRITNLPYNNLSGTAFPEGSFEALCAATDASETSDGYKKVQVEVFPINPVAFDTDEIFPTIYALPVPEAPEEGPEFPEPTEYTQPLFYYRLDSATPEEFFTGYTPSVTNSLISGYIPPAMVTGGAPVGNAYDIGYGNKINNIFAPFLPGAQAYIGRNGTASSYGTYTIAFKPLNRGSGTGTRYLIRQLNDVSVPKREGCIMQAYSVSSLYFIQQQFHINNTTHNNSYRNDTLDDGDWHQLTFVYGEQPSYTTVLDTMYMYIDGVFVKRWDIGTTSDQIAIEPGNPITVDISDTAAPNSFDGYLTEMAYWPERLSSAAVAELWQRFNTNNYRIWG